LPALLLSRNAANSAVRIVISSAMSSRLPLAEMIASCNATGDAVDTLRCAGLHGGHAWPAERA
jgi:hypothetical protein